MWTYNPRFSSLPGGVFFEYILFALIILCVLAYMLSTVDSIADDAKWAFWLEQFEYLVVVS